MSNWAQLHEDLLISIAQRIRSMEDYFAFRAVCNSWRVVATKQNFKGIPMRPHVPHLMLAADVDHYWEFYSLLENKVVTKIFLPETIKVETCMDAGYGWLFIVGQTEASLVNPINSDQIQISLSELPCDSFCDPQVFWKAVLSSSPYQNPSDFVLMVCKEKRGKGSLSYWKPGNKFWTKIITNPWGCVLDVMHYNGHFFAIDEWRRVLRFDLTLHKIQIIAQLPSFNSPPIHAWLPSDLYHKLYIMGSLGKLLIVARKRVRDYEFKVMEVDLITKKSTSIQDLGDRAIFVGHGTSVCIDGASKFPRIKKNHIYIGISNYNMADWSISTPHYAEEGQQLSFKDSSIWFIPH